MFAVYYAIPCHGGMNCHGGDNMRWSIIMAIVSFTAFGQTNITFSFAGDKGAEGCGKTKQAGIETSAESLRYTGTGWDAKMYRSVKLAKGNYMISGRARGTTILQLKRTFDYKEKALVNLNLTRDEWRTDWRQFEAESGNYILIISFGAAGETKGEVQWIKIEQAPIVPDTDTPDISLLEKERPDPAIVRGCMTGLSTNREDFSAMRELGANVVRIPFGPYMYNMAKYKKELWDAMPIMLDLLEAQVKCAQAEGIKVVPVLGSKLMEGKIKMNTHEFWDHPDLERNFCKIWEMVVKRLAPYRESIWALDLFNEALDWDQMPYAPRQWRTLAISGIKAIRAVDKDIWVIYETGPGGMHWGFDGLKPLPDTHVIYGAHFYSPHEFTHQGVGTTVGTDLAEVMKKINVRYPGDVNGLVWNKEAMEKSLATTVAFQSKYRVPIYFGEFSVIKWAPKEDAVKYLTDVVDIFEVNGWSWCYHSFREWPGWSFEHDESFWDQKSAAPKPVTYETERAKVIKAGLRKNGK